MAMRLATAEAATVAKIKPRRASPSRARRITSSGEAVKRNRDISSSQKMVPTLHVKTRQVMNLIKADEEGEEGDRVREQHPVTGRQRAAVFKHHGAAAVT